MQSTARRLANPRRSPPDGGYARGEETRAKIIKAAMMVFGQVGYERASTRQIALEAGVTPPALQYYFDSKDGLHRACAQFIVDLAHEHLSAPLARAQDVLAQASPDAAAEVLCDLMDAILEASLLTKEFPAAAGFSVRVKAEERSPAGALLKAKISEPILDVAARLIACAIGQPLDQTMRLRAGLILSQLSACHVHQDTTLQAIGWPDFEGPRRAIVRRVVREHTLAAVEAARAPANDHRAR